jgi:hypothetical protein
MILGFAISCGARDLKGPCAREDVLKNAPDWQAGLAAYSPKPEIIDRLRGVSREVRIDIYFGTWCSDSKVHVPACFKTLDLADTPLIQAALFAVPKNKKKRAPFFRGNSIEKLPTFIVYIDGREAGRIIETPKRSIEEDLLEIIEH